MSIQKLHQSVHTDVRDPGRAPQSVLMYVGAVLAFAALFISACGAQQSATSDTLESNGAHSGGHGGKAEAQASPTSQASYDQQFIDGMLAHHQSAIDMAEVALTKSEHPEVKRLAQEIIRAQEMENEQMTAWRNAWYPDSAAGDGHGGHSMPGMEMEGAMGVSADELRSASPFDKAFIDAMIPHHAAAIAMAEDARQKAEHAEIRDLAGRIIEAQQAEIDRMKEWRAQWYGS